MLLEGGKFSFLFSIHVLFSTFTNRSVTSSTKSHFKTEKFPPFCIILEKGDLIKMFFSFEVLLRKIFSSARKTRRGVNWNSPYSNTPSILPKFKTLQKTPPPPQDGQKIVNCTEKCGSCEFFGKFLQKCFWDSQTPSGILWGAWKWQSLGGGSLL